jgi:hypothetical protein
MSRMSMTGLGRPSCDGCSTVDIDPALIGTQAPKLDS